MKHFYRGIAVAAVTLVFAGCCGYQGVVHYDTRVDVARENERLTAETTSVQIENGTLKIEKLQTYTYDQKFRIDTKESVIYTEGHGALAIGNLIVYPLVLAFSPINLLVMEEKIQKEFGREYVYSKGRQSWNMLNPLICTSGTFKQKEEVVSSKNQKEVRTETRHVPIREGQIELVFGNQKKIFPVSVTLPEICNALFNHPLPPQTTKISVVFRGETYPLELNSAALLRPEELAAWNRIQNCQTPADAVDRNILQSLDALKPYISSPIYENEKNRLTSLLEQFQFPLRDLCDNRIPLSKDYVSGTAFRWVARQELAAMGEDFRRNPNAGMRLKERMNYASGCEEFRYKSLNSGVLTFSRGESLQDNSFSQAVLIRRQLEMPDTITLEMVVAEISKKNPGVKIQRYKERLAENAKRVPAGNYGIITVKSEIFQNTVEVRNENQKWLIVQKQIVTTYTGSSKALEAAGVSQNSTQNDGHVFVTISDCKFEEAFEKLKIERRKQQELEELRKKQEIQRRALDQI